MEIVPSTLSPDDLEALRLARSRLESPGLMVRLSDLIGRPVEFLLMRAYRVSPGLRRKIEDGSRAVLFKSLDFAIDTIPSRPPAAGPVTPRLWAHRAAVTASGLASGFFGLPGALVDLPISTGIILRSIADIARSEGHNLDHLDVRMACLECFALGGRSAKDNEAETGYWIVRAALGKTVSDAATFIAQKGLVENSAPPLVRLVTSLASRFSSVVTEEVAAKMVPVVGAASGAAINLLFIEHYQSMARGHFVVKRLEQRYGSALVEQTYRSLDSIK